MDDPQMAAAFLACRQIEGVAATARYGFAPASSTSYAPAFLTDPGRGFSDLVATVHTLLAQLRPAATVQTSAGGEFIETHLRYTGGTDSVATPNLSAQAGWIHLRSLERTLALRSATAGALVAAASTILSLSVSAANPLYLLHALATARSLEEALRRLLTAIEAAT